MLKVAYFVNHYPKISHSFVRREIRALEELGVTVLRMASRGWDDGSPDPADQAERARTRYTLQGGVPALLTASLAQALRSPRRFWNALSAALRLSKGSPRPWPVHLAYLAQACVMLRWMRTEAVDHVHAHFGTNPAEVVLLVEALGGPGYSFTVHGPEEFDHPQALHLSEKLARSRFTVAISSFGRSQLFRWAPASDWSRVEVVHCGLDASFLQAAPSPTDGPARLVCVGRLCEQKGQLLLVQAFARVLRSGIPATLVLAGDGEMRGEIESLVARLGIADRVTITGWIDGDRVRAELLQSRALVLPSFAEGLPVVLMEALALRRPVLSTYVAGIPELVRPGENGWLVPAGDLDALTAALAECLATDLPRLRQMGEAGRERVMQRHDVAQEAARLLQLFRRHAGHRERIGQGESLRACEMPGAGR